MVLDPITQAALAIQRGEEADGLAPKTGNTIPVSCGDRVVEGFTMWASQNTQPRLVNGVVVNSAGAAPLLAGATHATFAVALGYSLLPAAERGSTSVRRIWADDTLVFDATDPNVAPDFNGMKITFHQGDPLAQPDPIIAADMGALTPAFRNLIYIVIRDFPLQVGPTPTAPPPVVTAPTEVTTSVVLPYPGLSNAFANNNYDGGLANFGVTTGEILLTLPPNAAYPGGGFGGIFISWINDSESRTGHGGGYNSLNGSVTPYPYDIGNNRKVIAGNEGVDATVATTTTKPGTVTQAPAPEPTYRTTLPKIRVELSDSIVDTVVATPFDLLDNTDLPNLSDEFGGFVDWDAGLVYGWTNHSLPDGSRNFVLHAYSIKDQMELYRFSPCGSYPVNVGSPEEYTVQSPLIDFSIMQGAHDPINKFVFCLDMNGVSTTMPLLCIDLTTGQIINAHGNKSNGGEIDDVQITYRDCGDCVVSTTAGAKAYGVVTGAFLGTNVGLTVYDTKGNMTSGGHLTLSTSSPHVHNMLGYPIVDRADLLARFGISTLAQQDWYAFASCDREIHLLHGNTKKILDSTLMYVADAHVQGMFIDPTDFSLMLYKVDTANVHWLEKLALDANYSSAAGITPVFKGSVYSTVLPGGIGINGLCMNGLRESRYNAGQLVFPIGGSTGHQWATVDLGSGETIRTQTSPGIGGGGASTNDWVYDSATGNALALGAATPEVVVTMQLASTPGAALPLSSVLTWLAMAGGYDEADVTTEGFSPTADTVVGAVYTTRVGLWAYLTNLGQVYGYDYFQSDGKIKFVKGTSGDATKAAYTIDVDNLMQNGSGGDAALHENAITTLAAPVEVAGGVEVGYMDKDANFQNTTKVFQRARFPFRNVKPASAAKYETYFVMDGTEATRRAAALAFRQYAESVVQNLKLPFQFARLEPGDALNLIISGTAYLVATKELVYNPDWSIGFTGTNFNYRNDVNVAGDSALGVPNQPQGPSDSLPLLLDVPLVVASDDPGQLLAMTYTGVMSLGQSWWLGAALNVLMFGDPDWSRLYYSNRQVPYGNTAEGLPTTDTPFRTYEGTLDVVSISIPQGSNVDVGQTGLWAGTNAAFVGKPGRWELIYYESITWVNRRRFQITNILRGRRGTDVNCNNHVAGDYFIPFDRTYLQNTPIQTSHIAADISVAAVGQGTTKAAPIITNTLEGESLKPWAITYVKAVRQP